MANSYEVRRFDTYPPIGVVLSDNSTSPAIDLSPPVTGVHYELKGVTAPLITGVCTLGQVNITGVAQSSVTVTGVAPTTGYANGATIYAQGLIPAGTTIASGAGTSTLTLSQSATASGSGTIFVNMGIVYIPLNAGALANGFTTADTYTGECEIGRSGGSAQTVPNSFNSDFTVIVDTDLEDA